MSNSRVSPADVRRYYDANTGAFVRRGQGGRLGALHRAVWAPGITARDAAFRYVEDAIAREIDTLSLGRPANVLDLGCGIGGSLTYLAGQRPIHGAGVTISPVQARIGQDRVAALGLADRVRIIEGDYCALPAGVAAMDVAYAIESFVHGPSPERFFAEAARVLRPGGRLILCDDVRTGADGAGAQRTIRRFERGWHVNSLLTPDAWQEQASRAGFAHVATTDLTPYLELRRPRDRAIALLIAPIRWLPRLPARLAPLAGGTALQEGLTRGWIAYHCAIFERT